MATLDAPLTTSAAAPFTSAAALTTSAAAPLTSAAPASSAPPSVTTASAPRMSVPLTSASVPDAILALSRAFLDDPVARYIMLPGVDLPRALATFYGAILRLQYHDWSLCRVMSDGRGAALWQRDAGGRAASACGGGPRAGIGPWEQFLLLPSLGSVTGWGPRALLRILALGDCVDKAHARVCAGRPHLYLGILGVDPVRQGQGYARALMEPLLALADREGLLCYLESSKADNVPIYKRFGFEVAEVVGAWQGLLSDEEAAAAAVDGSGVGKVVDRSGAPLLWIMRREPRRGGNGS
jgi:GNAT superfamily N-acetyltransferase